MVLAAEKRMGDEGGGVDVAIVGLSPVYLKHLGFQHAACIVTDTGNTEIENGQDALKRAVKRRQRLKIGDAFLDARRFRRGRPLLEQCQLVTVSLFRCGE